MSAEQRVSTQQPSMHDMCGHAPEEAEVFRSVLSRIGDKWSVMLVGMLNDGPLRFTELKNLTPGISARMLTHTLRQLERDGLVERTAYPEIPPRVEYRSTKLGKSLTSPILAVAEWASTHQNEITVNRARYDEANDNE
ncbi:helix-turn-helix domain-containing protein [Leucobacter sp. UT-8R-CII-1-4]|uniref:winged helix-turn-helix transcriptional regulator n=1 Tax=Leucobacter sp. UT-8R-CII-1-4 TaxID=3040075 RepID=UPI0024A9C4C0|nr:helix-turn-helix domain-containing protein [Leucobacter sp. UT-8R-CII-1-4]MDI6023176.1 helix-turn-helix domain-containing protein [Leucobacter sp. UT-8R-CII-1-4]